jgi:hypothetical protein
MPGYVSYPQMEGSTSIWAQPMAACKFVMRKLCPRKLVPISNVLHAMVPIEPHGVEQVGFSVTPSPLACRYGLGGLEADCNQMPPMVPASLPR